MHYIISLAIIAFIFVFAIVIVRGTSFSAFFSDAFSFFKNLFRRSPVKQSKSERSHSKARSSSGRTIGLDFRDKKDKEQLFLTGTPAKTGIPVEIKVQDRYGNSVGTKTTNIDDFPLLVGRGSDSGEYKVKLCLPELTESPTTSRMHCTLERENDQIILRDCYDRDAAFTEEGKQCHSISVLHDTNEYIGCGYVIEKGGCANVDIGDFVFKIKNLSRLLPRGVPTYGYTEKQHIPTKDASNSKLRHAPTKEYKYD